MINDRSFTFNGNFYRFSIDPADESGNGSLHEIVAENQYSLDRFVGLEGWILDVGANCGVATVILAKQNPKARIIALEPHKPTFKLLDTNIINNTLGNVSLLCAALVGTKTRDAIMVCHRSVSGANCVNADYAKFAAHQNTKPEAVAVPVVAVDDLLWLNNIKHIAVLKIDCEGSEFDIFENSKLLDCRIDNLVGELHNLPYNERSTGAGLLLAKVREKVSGFVSVNVLGGG